MKRVLIISGIALTLLSSCVSKDQRLTVVNAYSGDTLYMNASETYSSNYKVGDRVDYDARSSQGYLIAPVYGKIVKIDTLK